MSFPRFKRRAMLAALCAIAPTLNASASEELMRSAGCLACHRVDQKLIGPAFLDVANRYSGDENAAAYLMQKIRDGGEGVWGDIPMQPNSVEKISDHDLRELIEWVLGLEPDQR